MGPPPRGTVPPEMIEPSSSRDTEVERVWVRDEVPAVVPVLWVVFMGEVEVEGGVGDGAVAVADLIPVMMYRGLR